MDIELWHILLLTLVGIAAGFLNVVAGGGSLLTLPEPLPKWAGSFVEATHAAWEAYMAAPSRANQEIARLNTGLTQDVLTCVTNAQTEFVAGSDGMGAMSADRWNAVAGTLTAQGLLPEGSKATDAWKTMR